MFENICNRTKNQAQDQVTISNLFPQLFPVPEHITHEYIQAVADVATLLNLVQPYNVGDMEIKFDSVVDDGYTPHMGVGIGVLTPTPILGACLMA